MKRRLVAGLIRLYPSRWRAEYGEELAEILLRRPLGVRVLLDVTVGALRQHEPWVLIGVPLFVWCVAYRLTLSMGWKYLNQATAVGPAPALLLFLGIGSWTILRSAHGAMKISMLAATPLLTGGILLMAWKYPQGIGVALTPAVFLYLVIGFWTVFRTGRGGGRAAIKLTMLVTLPMLATGLLGYAHSDRLGVLFNYAIQISIAGLIGWLGGLAGQLARRLSHAR